MAENINSRNNLQPLLAEKRTNQLLDAHDRIDNKKTTEKKTLYNANNKNGANCDRNNGHYRSPR